MRTWAMINHNVRDAAKENGITLDLIGQPLKVGDTVLVKGHYSVNMDTIATITKINRVNVKVDLEKQYMNYDAHSQAMDEWQAAGASPNKMPRWSDFRETVLESTSRWPGDLIKFDAQLDLASKAQENLIEEYPEIFL